MNIRSSAVQFDFEWFAIDCLQSIERPWLTEPITFFTTKKAKHRMFSITLLILLGLEACSSKGRTLLRHIASSRYEGEHIAFKVEMYFSVIAWRIVRCRQCSLCLRSTYSRLFILFSNCSWVVGRNLTSGCCAIPITLRRRNLIFWVLQSISCSIFIRFLVGSVIKVLRSMMVRYCQCSWWL